MGIQMYRTLLLLLSPLPTLILTKNLHALMHTTFKISLFGGFNFTVMLEISAFHSYQITQHY